MEFSRRIDALAEQLHTLGWPMNFGSPELDAALRTLEAERGSIQPSPIFDQYGHRYRCGDSGLLVSQAAPLEALEAARDALVPDALVFGATTPRMPVGVPNWLGPAGNFAIFGLENGNWSYFGARPVQGLPPIATPWGPIRHGLSYVGTAGQAADGSFTDQAGVGWAGTVPTPWGDVLLFANSRQDALTLGNAFQDRGRRIVNVNVGAAYSLNDGAARLLAGKFPGASLVLEGASQTTGANVWGGVAYSQAPIQMVVEDGAPTALIINGNEIPMDQLAALFGEDIEMRAMNGGFMPSSLNNSVLRDFGPRYTNLQREASQWGQVIERALDRGLVDPAQQYDLMLQALENPDAVFGALPPQGRLAAQVTVNALLGRTDEANRLAAQLYPYDNTVDGVRPRGLAALRIDALAELDGARAGGERVSYGFVGVPGVGQAELRYDPAAELYSVHGRNGAQHPLPNAATLEDTAHRRAPSSPAAASRRRISTRSRATTARRSAPSPPASRPGSARATPACRASASWRSAGTAAPAPTRRMGPTTRSTRSRESRRRPRPRNAPAS